MGEKETLVLFIVTLCFIFFGLQSRAIDVSANESTVAIVADAGNSFTEE